MKLKNVLSVVAGLLAFAPSFAHADLVPSGGDDSVAIQAAIDGAGPGGTVTLGAGLFRLGTQLTIGNGVTLIGQGRDETVLKYTGSEGSSGRVATITDYGVLSSVTATGGKVSGNHISGGGILISGGGTVTWCCVTNNYAKRGQGGGICVQGKGSSETYEARIDHTIVADNACGTMNYDNSGGGIGVFTDTSTVMKRVEIDTCLVYGNRAGNANKDGYGGGIGFKGSAYNMLSAEIRNTTIAGNSVTGKGGGIYFPFKPQSSKPEKGKVSLVNNIIAGNAATVCDEAVTFADIAFESETVKSGVVGNISYCLFGLESEVFGTGSSFGDPGFVDAGKGDYHLSAPKKLGYETGEEILDLDGLERTGAPDVGCYEYSEPPVPTTQVAPPTVSPADETAFYPSITVTLGCKTADAEIYYTTDESEPDESSEPYAGPFELTETTTIKVRAFKDGLDPSEIVTATYVNEGARPPAFGTVSVSARPTSATVSGTIASVGNNGATACDVYLALDGAAAEKVVENVTTSFKFQISGLTKETPYSYVLSISNNAMTAMGAVTDGSFVTPQEGIQPGGSPTETRLAIQSAIDAAAAESPAGTVTLLAGLFELDAQLMVTGGVTLVGNGWKETTLRYVGDAYGNDSRAATLKGGGILKCVTVTGGTISGANSHGGGLLIDGSGTVSWCNVTGNRNSYAVGGGIGVVGAGLATIDHTIVSSNAAPGIASLPGNIPCGAGIGIVGVTSGKDSIEVVIDTCLVYDNACGAQSAGNGGGICVKGYYVKSALVRNTTVSGNSASGSGGGLYLEGAFAKTTSVSLENDIFAGNAVNGDEANVTVADDRMMARTTAAACFFGLESEAFGTGSGFGDPGFVDAANGNYHLSKVLRLGYRTQETLLDLDGVERKGSLDAGCYASPRRGLIIMVQ